MHRVYRSLRLNLPRRTRRRLPTRPAQPLAARPIPNEVWSLDFMSDALYQGRRFRTLNVIDDGMREGLEIEVDTNLPAARVVRVLERLVSLRGTPKALRSDNGPEFPAEAYTDGCQAKGIEIRYIQPGKPDQNAYVARFNRSDRQEILDAYLFASLDEVRSISEQWLTVYNEQRPRRRSEACLWQSSEQRSLKPKTPTMGCLLDGGAYRLATILPNYLQSAIYRANLLQEISRVTAASQPAHAEWFSRNSGCKRRDRL